MFNIHDLKRDQMMLTGRFAKKGYDWWWHSFTAINKKTGEEAPFFIEFFLINPKLAKASPTLGQDPEGKKPSYLMVKCGKWGKEKKQLHRFYSWKEIQVHAKEPYSVNAKECFASETSLHGHVKVSEEDLAAHPGMMSDVGEMSFDLKVEKKIAFNVGYGASSLFRFLKAFQMYWHAEGMKTLYEGRIVFDGEEYIVKKDSSYGYADKNWGNGFTTPWVWLASNNLYSKKLKKKLENSAFDIGGGKPKAFGISLPRKLLGVFYYEGDESYEFNFAKFWMGIKTVFSGNLEGEEFVWHVRQENHKRAMEAEIRCKVKDMLFVNYEDPEGVKRFHHLYNGGNGYGSVKLYKKAKGEWALVDEIEAKNVGCEYGEFDAE